MVRTKQLGVNVIGIDGSRPVDLKFCVDIEYLKSTIAYGLIRDARSYDSLTDENLRAYPENEATETRNTVTQRA